MKISTSRLIGIALDWAVAMCEGESQASTLSLIPLDEPERTDKWRLAYHPNKADNYSTDWAQGGPIIRREGISLNHKWYNGEWHATKQINPNAPTLPERLHQITRWHESDPLIAAMRCYVASKLGNKVDVPDELIQP